MDFADLVRFAGVEQDALGRGRLAGIDVGHDAEVTIILDFIFAGHCLETFSFCGPVPARWNSLPAVVRERLVGVRHLVGIFALLDRSAAVVGRIEQFT